MYRVSSNTRVSDEFFSVGGTNSSAAGAAMSSPNPKPTTTAAAAAAATTAASDLDHLPTYNPFSHVGKKEKNRFRSAENAIHLIPLMLVLCAIILWFFSSPVDLVNESDSLVARVGGSLTSKASAAADSGHTNSSWESDLEQEDQDSVVQSTDSETKTIR